MPRSRNFAILIPKDAIQIIGIDPGTKTGVAVWDRSKKMFTKLVTKDIDEAWEIVQEYYKKDRSFIMIENPNLRTFFGDTGKEIYQGAGSIKRDWAIWSRRLKNAGFEYLPLAPKEVHGINNHDVFCKVINQHFSKTSIHSRDAAMMVYRR
jgi:hypothetical protein